MSFFFINLELFFLSKGFKRNCNIQRKIHLENRKNMPQNNPRVAIWYISSNIFFLENCYFVLTAWNFKKWFKLYGVKNAIIVFS